MWYVNITVFGFRVMKQILYRAYRQDRAVREYPQRSRCLPARSLARTSQTN